MKPEEVDRAMVNEAANRLRIIHWDGMGCDTHGTSACTNCFGPSPMTAHEVAAEVLAAVLPSYKQSVTAKYRRFVKAVREITRGGESMQTPKSQGGGGDECTISPPELRQALRDLRDGRQ